jgi:hypothetical protein
MKRLQKIEWSLSAAVLLLNLGAIYQPLTDSFKTVGLDHRQDRLVLAQSAPNPPSPQTVDRTAMAESGFPWRWWLLIPLGGGLLWWSKNRRSRPNPDEIEIFTDANVVLLDSNGSRAAATAIEPAAPVTLEAGALSDDEDRSTAGNAGQKLGDPAVIPQQEETIQLLEERLVVNLHQRKVGEVIVRKEIETRIVEIPIRREKLIVEQVSPEFKQLAVIDLGQTQEAAVAAAETEFLPTIEAKFTSATAAMQFLQQIIAERPSSSLQSLQLSIVLKAADLPAVDRRRLDNNSNSPTASVTG